MEINEIIRIAAAAVAAIIAVIFIATDQKHKITEWLKYAVSEAEKILGSKTGQLKLRLVYDRFKQRFPVAAAILPFRVFSAWVDAALDTLNEWLDTNSRIGECITEDNNGDIHE